MTAPVPQSNVLQFVAVSPRAAGSIMRAPLNTALPTTSYATLPNTWLDLGYADENGLRQKENRSNTDVFVWGGALGGTIQDKYDRTMDFKLMQLMNAQVLATAYGINNVSVIPATSQQGNEIAVKMNPNLLDTQSWIFDGFFNAMLVRIVIPIGRVIAIGEVDLTHKMFSNIACTMKAYPDANRNHGYMYLNDGLHL
jgi:hypothetical protein